MTARDYSDYDVPEEPSRPPRRRRRRVVQAVRTAVERLSWLAEPLVLSSHGLRQEPVVAPQFPPWEIVEVPRIEQWAPQANIVLREITSAMLDRAGHTVGQLTKTARERRNYEPVAQVAAELLAKVRAAHDAWHRLRRIAGPTVQTARDLMVVASLTLPSWERPRQRHTEVPTWPVPHSASRKPGPRVRSSKRAKTPKRPKPDETCDLQAFLSSWADPEGCLRLLDRFDPELVRAAADGLSADPSMPSRVRAAATSWKGRVSGVSRSVSQGIPFWLASRLPSSMRGIDAQFLRELVSEEATRIVVRWIATLDHRPERLSLSQFQDASQRPACDADLAQLLRALARENCTIPEELCELPEQDQAWIAAAVPCVAPQVVPQLLNRASQARLPQLRTFLLTIDCWWSQRLSPDQQLHAFRLTQPVAWRSFVLNRHGKLDDDTLKSYRGALCEAWLTYALISNGMRHDEVEEEILPKLRSHEAVWPLLRACARGKAATREAVGLLDQLTSIAPRGTPPGEALEETRTLPIDGLLYLVGRPETSTISEVVGLVCDWRRSGRIPADVTRILLQWAAEDLCWVEDRPSNRSRRWKAWRPRFPRLLEHLAQVPDGHAEGQVTLLAHAASHLRPESVAAGFTPLLTIIAGLVASGRVQNGYFIGRFLSIVVGAYVADIRGRLDRDQLRPEEEQEIAEACFAGKSALLDVADDTNRWHLVIQGLEFWCGPHELHAVLRRLLRTHPTSAFDLVYRYGLVPVPDHGFLGQRVRHWAHPSSVPELRSGEALPESLIEQLRASDRLEAEARRMVFLSNELEVPPSWTSGLKRFIDADKREKEFQELSRKQASGALSSGQRGRLMLLSKRRPPRPLSPEQQARVAEKLAEAGDLLLCQLLANEADRCLRQRLRRLVGDDADQVEMSEEVRNAVRLYSGLKENRRVLRRLLKAWFEGERDWVQNHPANRDWLNRAREAGKDLDAWLRGWRKNFRKPRRLRLYISQDPLEVLQMGQLFGSCLRIGGEFSHSAVANAVDVNKHVIYARDENDQIVARRLIAIDSKFRLVCFAIYSVSDEPLNPPFDRFCLEFARECGLAIIHPDIDYEVEPLVAKAWYDDGAVKVPSYSSVSIQSSSPGRSGQRGSGRTP